MYGGAKLTPNDEEGVTREKNHFRSIVVTAFHQSKCYAVQSTGDQYLAVTCLEKMDVDPVLSVRTFF